MFWEISGSYPAYSAALIGVFALRLLSSLIKLDFFLTQFSVCQEQFPLSRTR